MHRCPAALSPPKGRQAGMRSSSVGQQLAMRRTQLCRPPFFPGQPDDYRYVPETCVRKRRTPARPAQQRQQRRPSYPYSPEHVTQLQEYLQPALAAAAAKVASRGIQAAPTRARVAGLEFLAQHLDGYLLEMLRKPAAAPPLPFLRGLLRGDPKYTALTPANQETAFAKIVKITLGVLDV